MCNASRKIDRGVLCRTFLIKIVFGIAALAVASLICAWNVEAGEKVLRVAIPGNPATLDSCYSANHDAMVVSQLIFENLVQVDVNGNLQPQLAKKLPEISEDRKTYTFDLRDDVYFHNGQKMTAEDVKYSFDWVLNPASKAMRHKLFNRIEKVVVESPTRVRFELRERYRPWLYYLTKYMAIFPKGSREKYGNQHFKASPKDVGTGPGMFVEWRHNDYVELKRNPNYWQKDLPMWERVIVRVIPEDSVRVAYLVSGQVDIISAPPPKDYVRIKEMPGIIGGKRLCLGGWYFLLQNHKKPPFDDVHFRKAVSHAIDRKEICEKVYYKLLEPTSIPGPPGGWWFSEEADDLNTFDLEKAKDHLRKSKYPNGAEFEILTPSQPYLIDVKEASVVIQAQLAKLNIRPRINIVEEGLIIDQVLKGNHQAAYQVWMSPGEPTYMIDTIYGKRGVLWKTCSYDNPEFEKTISDSYTTIDREKLKRIYGEMFDILARDNPHTVIGSVYASNLWTDKVKNFNVNQGLTMRVREVYKETW
jgi:peptide/nickel transport system substrate-binding protein